jgi:hypothetical protein
MKTNRKLHSASTMCTFVLLTLALPGTALGKDHHGPDNERDHHRHEPAKTLYVWAGDQARVAPDFLAVINFDEDSADYGKVIGTVPVPPPGNVGNEAHHCHLSADRNILACGGLLSDDVLMDAAKRYRVDTGKLQKAVSAELAAKRDKKTKDRKTAA